MENGRDLALEWAAILEAHRRDEAAAVIASRQRITLSPEARRRITERALALAAHVRQSVSRHIGVEMFLKEYDLSSREGVALMCLAEALLRIEDAHTADALIRDKIGSSQWQLHLGQADSLMVNASTWGLMLTGRLVNWSTESQDHPFTVLRRLVARSSDAVIREALRRAMGIMGAQFVRGETIAEGLKRGAAAEAQGYRYSYDMLGEAARTGADAERYFEAYAHAIRSLGAARGDRGVVASPGISIKLSALHPRFEETKRERVETELQERALALAGMAKAAGIGLTIDAEEADRLALTLDLFRALAIAPALAGWDGLGLAVQAYQKRALPVIDWLIRLAAASGRRLMVRLVNGAYWDTEIKIAQERGLAGYPVFTRKLATDLSYVACAERLLAAPRAIYPQFATHNARTVATVLELAGRSRDFEFQKLHGMGDALYERLMADEGGSLACRIYAPVGQHRDLLAYLVRRLLENGANSSFVHQVADASVPLEKLVEDPLERLSAAPYAPHPLVPSPRDLYGERANARGVDLWDRRTLDELRNAILKARMAARRDHGRPPRPGALAVCEPADRTRPVGQVFLPGPPEIERALAAASDAAPGWDATPAGARSAALAAAADRLEAEMTDLVQLCVREGGKTIADAVAEVREAVDFCRYYAERARADFATPQSLIGPTGEHNQLSLHGRGVFACISPWNFPLAIFTGQVAAALAAGNAVLAKPAEQTPLIAERAVAILHAAGIPPSVLHLLPGDGTVGAALVADPRIGGVAFTGSTETAQAINRTLAGRPGPIVPLIAETGGQNAMIVDSSALPEQVVTDIVSSAFQSAGQRCSALRVLCLQDEAAPRILEMLAGAMAELAVGDPAEPATDVGPVIDAAARTMLTEHAAAMRRRGRLLAETPLPGGLADGHYFAPVAFEIDSLDLLTREVFGPILHVVRFAAGRLDALLAAIRRTGYGLTLGIHSRVDGFVAHIHSRLGVGNTYVNRNMIGAVVGVQPFGGEGLSGTGPKAGGPRYLHRFAVERTLTINTAATGGNAALMASLD